MTTPFFWEVKPHLSRSRETVNSRGRVQQGSVSNGAEKQAFVTGGLVKVVRVGLPPPTPYFSHLHNYHQHQNSTLNSAHAWNEKNKMPCVHRCERGFILKFRMHSSSWKQHFHVIPTSVYLVWFVGLLAHCGSLNTVIVKVIWERFVFNIWKATRSLPGLTTRKTMTQWMLECFALQG